MKKLLFVFLVLTFLVSCFSEEESRNVDDKFSGKVTLTVDDYEFEDNTRSMLDMDWDGTKILFGWYLDYDRIGIFPIAPTTNCQAVQTINYEDDEGLTSAFDGEGWALLRGNTYAAYSPFNGKVPSETPYTDIPVTMTGQKQVSNESLVHIGEKYDYMYAKAVVPGEGEVVTFNFLHIGAIVMLNLTLPENTSWASATLTSEESVFVKSCTMDVSNGTLANKVTDKSMTLALDKVSGDKLVLFMAVLPCTTGKLTLNVTSVLGMNYYATLDSKTLRAGKAYKWNAELDYMCFRKGTAPSEAVAVDLGLPSGLKWANMNVGAKKVTDYGTYFAWGEINGCEYINDTDCVPAIMDGNSNGWSKGVNPNYISGQPKTDYGSLTYYKWSNGSGGRSLKYSSISKLRPEDDAAVANWGGEWRIPNKNEVKELLANCYWQWTSNYDGTGVSGVIAYKVKSEGDKGKYRTSSSNSYSLSDTHIFLPAAGGRYESSFSNAGYAGRYWSSVSATEINHYDARSLFFAESYLTDFSTSQFCGQTIRAVCP